MCSFQVFQAEGIAGVKPRAETGVFKNGQANPCGESMVCTWGEPDDEAGAFPGSSPRRPTARHTQCPWPTHLPSLFFPGQ